MYNIIGNRKIFLTFSAVLVLASFVAVGVFGFREGIDFKGGSLWSFKGGERPDPLRVEAAVKSALATEEVRVSAAEGTTVIVRMPELSEEEHTKIKEAVGKEVAGFEELSFQSIGPSVGEALRTKSITAIVLVMIGISLYIAYAFRKVYRPVSSWKYGVITLLSLVHDVAIPAGFLAILGHYQGVEIDANFLVALLVIMGFSVHDTIVVFDRIRENLLRERGKEFGAVINESVNQTLARSINTSLTLILVLIALYFVGPLNLQYFVLTMLIGVVTGIYSSIFMASPLLYVWQRISTRRAT